MNAETKERFVKKSLFIKVIRRYLEDHGYMEIETPVLIDQPSGASARPFMSHHNALDMDVCLIVGSDFLSRFDPARLQH